MTPGRIETKGTNLFAGVYNNSVYRTSDGGVNWSPANNGITNNSVSAFASQGSYLFAGTQGGVFRSEDNGDNWVPVNNGLTTLNIKSLEFDGNYLYAGTHPGIFQSNDQGVNWTPVNTGILNRTISAFFESGPTIFAGLTSGGMYRSSDNGLTWSEVNNGIPNSATITSFTAIGNYLFAGSTGTGNYRSDDQGETWSNIGTSNLYNIAALAVIGQDIYAAIINSGIFRSTDYGVTWQEKHWGLGPEDQRMRALYAMENTLYASAKRRNQEHKEHVAELKLIEERIRQETPGALIARMDSMDRDRTEFVRRAADLDFKQKQIEASHTRLERKVGDAHLRSDNAETKAAAVEQRVEARLSQLIAEHQDSRTQLAEIAKDLASLKDSLSGLACAERDRHEGKKPAFCPLHKIACPLNGEKDKDNA